jgi:hypothetical protein
MGISHPRPAMRKGERRIVEQRLARHAGIMRQLEAAGIPREEASRKAFEIVKAREKARDHRENIETARALEIVERDFR